MLSAAQTTIHAIVSGIFAGLLLLASGGSSGQSNTPVPPVTVTSPSSGKEIEAIRDISGKAIESAKSDVEMVKWIFIAFTSVLTSGGVILSLLGYKSLMEVRVYHKEEAERDAKKISEVREALVSMMVLQQFADRNYDHLSKTATHKRELKQKLSGTNRASVMHAAFIQKYSAAARQVPPTAAEKEQLGVEWEQELRIVESESEEIFALIVVDLIEMRRWSAKIRSPRWDAWIEGFQGVSLHLAGRYKDALPCLEKACELARSEKHRDDENRSRLASHLYNRACCQAMLGDDTAALSSLEETLALAAWRWKEAKDDRDFERFQDYPWFKKMLKASETAL